MKDEAHVDTVVMEKKVKTTELTLRSSKNDDDAINDQKVIRVNLWTKMLKNVITVCFQFPFIKMYFYCCELRLFFKFSLNKQALLQCSTQ